MEDQFNNADGGSLASLAEVPVLSIGCKTRGLRVRLPSDCSLVRQRSASTALTLCQSTAPLRLSDTAYQLWCDSGVPLISAVSPLLSLPAAALVTFIATADTFLRQMTFFIVSVFVEKVVNRSTPDTSACGSHVSFTSTSIRTRAISIF